MHMKNAIKKSALIVWSIAWIIGAATIQLTDDIMDEGQKSFRVVTPGATYFYHKEGAGFSSLVDKAGKDWISYNSSSGSSGKYRGIPNMVWKSPEADNRAFHPGHTGSWGSTTTLESKSSGKVTIKSVAKVNGWTCYWDFYPSHATMRLTEKPAGATYWFLYEGTPNGTFSTSTNYMMRSDSKTRMPLGQRFRGGYQACRILVYCAFSSESVLIAAIVTPIFVKASLLNWKSRTCILHTGQCRPL